MHLKMCKTTLNQKFKNKNRNGGKQNKIILEMQAKLCGIQGRKMQMKI